MKDNQVGGPIIVWADYDTDGWQPTSFGDVDAALSYVASGSTGSAWVITRAVRLGETPWPTNYQTVFVRRPNLP